MGTVPMPLRLAGLPRSMGWLPFATLALCVLGVADAAYQCYADVTNTGLAGCAAKVDACVTVQHSPEAYIFGIPVAVFGVVFYAFMVVICSPPAWRSPLPAVRRLRLAAVVTRHARPGRVPGVGARLRARAAALTWAGIMGPMGVVTVATCQFPVGADIRANLGYVKRQMRLAQQRGADVAHFPEGALSGYAGTDFDTFAGYDWAELKQAMSEVLGHARRLRIWAVLGSAHPLGGGRKPHNSLYIIDSSGQIIDRYDKMFCSGDPDGRSGDLAHYSPGSHLSCWAVNGVRCGALICYDYRFPELYRGYRKQGVELVFHSFHAANAQPQRIAESEKVIGPELKALNKAATYTYPGITMPAAMTAEAAFNHVWISCPNSSAPQSCWPAFAVRADGVTVGRLRRNRPGVLVTTVDTGQELYDSTVAWRYRAMAGVFHSGTLVSDPRSDDRTTL